MAAERVRLPVIVDPTVGLPYRGRKRCVSWGLAGWLAVGLNLYC